jgi:ketosteroid isomerase-like protein
MLKLTNWSRGAAAGTLALLLMSGAPLQAADNPQVSAQIMALARAQWASEIAGETMAQQNASLAEDYTEFNGDFPTLLVGKTMSTRMGEVTPNDKAMYSDMQNARVQTYGDTAILTYNFAGLRRAGDGKIAPSLAKSTRVYVKQGGKWMLVQPRML